jgi:hypothetical protein
MKQKTLLTVLQNGYFSVEAICYLVSLQYSLTSSHLEFILMTQNKWIRSIIIVLNKILLLQKTLETVFLTGYFSVEAICSLMSII